MYILLSIWISKIQFACYTQRNCAFNAAVAYCLFGFQRYNLHAIHNNRVTGARSRYIVYLDFKDTICMLYTTELCLQRCRRLLSIWISKIQFACYTQHVAATHPPPKYCLFGFQRYNLHAIHNYSGGASCIPSIVYLDFKDTICMLYTTYVTRDSPRI